MLERTQIPKNFASTIHLTLTRQCNMSCSYCSSNACAPWPQDDMTTEEWFEVINQVTDAYGPAVIVVKGGEPMLREDFFVILSHLKSKGHFIFLVTNGILIRDAVTAERLAQYVDQMEISLDGVSPETTDPVKGVGMFDRIMTGIDLVADTRIKLGLSFVILEENQSILWKDLETFLKERGAEKTAVRIDNRIDFPEDQGQGDFFDFLRQAKKLACHGRLGRNPASFELEVDASGCLHPGSLSGRSSEAAC